MGALLQSLPLHASLDAVPTSVYMQFPISHDKLTTYNWFQTLVCRWVQYRPHQVFILHCQARKNKYMLHIQTYIFPLQKNIYNT